MKGAKHVQCAGGPRPETPPSPDPLCSLAFSRLRAWVEAVMPSVPSSCRLARERLVPRVSGRMEEAGAPVLRAPPCWAGGPGPGPSTRG